MLRALRLLTNALTVLAGLSVALMMFHVVADVIGKYVFHYPVPSTAEVVANYYMIASVFLILAFVEARGSAISVDLVFDNVGPATQRVMRKIGQLGTLIFSAGLGWFSWDVAMRAFNTNETIDGLWRVTVWPAKFMLPLGLAIACLVLVIKIVAGDRVRLNDNASQNHSH